MFKRGEAPLLKIFPPILLIVIASPSTEGRSNLYHPFWRLLRRQAPRNDREEKKEEGDKGGWGQLIHNKMIDFSLLKIVPAEESHSEFSYQLKKSAYGDYIKEIWGWDEERQIEFHAQDWLNKKPEIILYDNQPIGTIYLNEDKDYIEIAQFIILSEYQNKGIGTYILKGILDRADRSGLITRLDYLHTNPVASLYKRFNFKVVRSDDIFHFTERKPGGTA